MAGVATRSNKMSLSAMKNAQNIKCNVGDFTAEIIAWVSGEQPTVLANVNLGAVIAGISNMRLYSKAMFLRAEPEAQELIGSSDLRCATECGNPTSYYRQSPTQEQRTALSRPRRYSVQAERDHYDLVVSNLAMGLEGFPSGHGLSYNRMSLLDESRSNDLSSEITFLRRSLCSLLLQPMTESGNREQTCPQVIDDLRVREVDLNAAEVEQEGQNVQERTTDKIPDPGPCDFPMTTGHLEIQAVSEAVKEMSNAVLSLKNVIKDLPSQLSQDHHTILQNKLEDVRRAVLRFPDCLTSLLVRRTAELDAIRKDKDAAAGTMRAAEEKMAAAEAKEIRLVEETRAIDRDRGLAEEKMKAATELLRAVETREKLVAGRERRVVRLEEEQALEDLNYGADAAMEDGAEAAAAEARENERSTNPSMRLPTAVDNENTPTDPEKISNPHPARERALLVRDTAMAAKEEDLWRRENILAFRVTNLQHRETALFAREQLLEQMKIAQIQLAENWKAQVDASYAGLEAEGENLRAIFRALIALKGRVEETQAKARNLVGEARDVIGKGGADAGEDRRAWRLKY